MSEIEKAFTFLQDNIPQWLRDINALEEKVTAMQAEMVKVQVSKSPFKHKTESMESIRPGKLDAIAEGPAPSQGAQTDPVGARKRKTHSVLSGRASGPSRYRQRTMVVTSYDGNMQKSFELMVRAIGTGRNHLRKAKMEAKMNELSALAGSSEDDDEGDDDEDEAMMAKISYRPRMASMRVRATARQTSGASGNVSAPAALFDTTDKTLEQAQSLCEKAAHVALRDGDCRKELEGVRKGFLDVFETAKTEVTKRAIPRSPDPQNTLGHETPATSVSSTEPSYKKHFPQLSRLPSETQSEPKKTLPAISAATVPTAPKTLEIEVDDDEDDEDDFVMPPLRLTSRLGGCA